MESSEEVLRQEKAFLEQRKSREGLRLLNPVDKSEVEEYD